MKTKWKLDRTNIAIASALAAALSTHVYAGSGEATPATNNTSFQKLDTDRDGFLSRDEAGRLRGMGNVFAEADDNRDNRLNEEEFVKAQAIHDRVRTKALIDDSVITAKIKAAFVKDRDVTALKVNVKTDQGIVLLSGFVQNEQQARRAQEIAAAIEGVQSVRSNLVVKS